MTTGRPGRITALGDRPFPSACVSRTHNLGPNQAPQRLFFQQNHAVFRRKLLAVLNWNLYCSNANCVVNPPWTARLPSEKTRHLLQNGPSVAVESVL